MNKLNKSLVSFAAMTGSFAAVGGPVQAETADTSDGDYVVKELSERQRDILVDQGILTCFVKPEVRGALGIITLQEEFAERGYSRSGIDGIDGKKFCQDTYKIQVDNELYVDGVVGNQMVSFFGGLPSLMQEHGLRFSNESPRSDRVKENNNSDSTCKEIRLTRWAEKRIPGSDGDLILDNGVEARAVQVALNAKGYKVGNPNGIIGSRTLKGFTNLQIDKFEKADCLLGSQTSKALDMKNEPKNSVVVTSKKKTFNPNTDCRTSSSCEISVDLSSNSMLIAKNNWGAGYGEVLFRSPIQDGKPGHETDTGDFVLGRVEYGPDGNPWRYSTIQSRNAQEPALYKFRRIIPAAGGWSGEGFHGSKSYGIGLGSLGCVRTPIATMDLMEDMPTGTRINVHN